MRGKAGFWGGEEEGTAGPVWVDLSTRWHPYFLIFVFSFSLEEKLVQVIAEQMQS